MGLPSRVFCLLFILTGFLFLLHFRSGGSSSAAARLAARKAAKRSGRERAFSTSEDGKFGGTLGAPGAAPGSTKNLGKNCRKSRNGYGRGLPKKGTELKKCGVGSKFFISSNHLAFYKSG